MIHRVLTNPPYAGLFVYGRRVQQAKPGDPLQLRSHRRPLEEWEMVVPDVYPPYLSEAQHLGNREMLQANQHNFVKKRRRAPRKGPGLLTGLVVCRRCGRRMTLSYGGEHHVYSAGASG
jgi:Recombinase